VADLWVIQQDPVRPSPAFWLVILVVQAGEAEELIGRFSGPPAVIRSGNRLYRSTTSTYRRNLAQLGKS
jgi:hypothetical protein